MYFLSLDTSTKFLCIVLAQGARVLKYYNRLQERGHSRLLISTIENILRKSKLKLTDIGCLAVDNGPGSFTGIRIGLAASKGLAMALKIPLVSFSSLDVLAFNLKNKGGLVCPIIDAKRGQVYGARYEFTKAGFKRKGNYFLGDIFKFLKKLNGRVYFTGDALSIYREQIKGAKNFNASFAAEKFWYPQAVALAETAHLLYKRKEFKRADKLCALYLYPDTCTVRKKSKIKNQK